MMVKNTRGFTLLELVLSIALLSILAVITIPLYRTFQVKNTLDTGTYEIVAALRRAQLLSQAAEADGQWGVAVHSGSVTIFQGMSYAARNAALDETMTLVSSVIPSGTSEIVFSEVTGLPVSAGTLTLTSSTGLQRIITINAKGMLTY